MKTKKVLTIIAIAFWASIFFYSCQTRKEKIDYTIIEKLIEQTAENYIEELNIKGISVGFIDIDGYRFKEGFGNAHGNSFYSMASVTKIITGLAIMQLKEDGKITLDTPIVNYIPEFALKNPYPGSTAITTRHLVTHTSGLSRDNLAAAQGYCPSEDSHLVNYLNNHFQALPAGYRHSYSNPGVELLGLLIEKVSGQDYLTYIDKKILSPLEMTKSNFTNKMTSNMHNAGAFTMFSDSSYTEMPINYIAAGGLKSNVPEMLNLVELFLDKGKNKKYNIVSPTGFEMMYTQQNNNVLLDTDVQTGVQFFLEDMPGPFKGKLVYHGGGAIYNNTMLMMAPEYGLGVVVFSNTAGSYPQVDRLARSIIYKALNLKTGIDYKAAESVLPEKTEWPFDEIQKLTGNYYTASNIITIREDSNDIIAEVRGNQFPVVFYDNGYFTYYEGSYLKVKEIDGKKIMFSYDGYNLTPIGRDEKVIKSIPESIISSLGTYHLIETCPEGALGFYERIRIDTVNTNLAAYMLPEKIVRDIFGIANEMQIILKPLNDTTAVMAGFGRYPREVIYFDNKNNKIRFSGLSFIKK